MLEVATRPTISGESVSLCTSHRRPNVSDHIPMLEKAAASQKSWYSRYRKAANPDLPITLLSRDPFQSATVQRTPRPCR